MTTTRSDDGVTAMRQRGGAPRLEPQPSGTSRTRAPDPQDEDPIFDLGYLKAINSLHQAAMEERRNEQETVLHQPPCSPQLSEYTAVSTNQPRTRLNVKTAQNVRQVRLHRMLSRYQ